jgi:hypothetical protein
VQKLLFILLISFVTPIFAQQEMVKVKTKVIDENNNPIPFADVAFRRMQLGFLLIKKEISVLIC